MADRRVTNSGKDQDGDITALCNPNESWRRRSKADAVDDIKKRLHRYYVKSGSVETDIHVVDGKHLRTDPDKTNKNNLNDLPDC